MTDQPIAATHPAQGGVTAARGFRASGVHAGFRKDPERLDLALVVADEPCACAAVFTKNVFCSAPVIVSRAQLGADQPGEPAYGTARAVVVNSGNANAATGEPGLEAARETARIAGDAVGCPASEVLVASTGVIGVQLPLAPFGIGLPAAASLLSAGGGADAARAIMTTDTVKKELAVTVAIGGQKVTIGAIAKGSGMIHPNMGTMLCFLTTDCAITQEMLQDALHDIVPRTFNRVTVDGDTSTNDMCVILANGMAENPLIEWKDDNYTVFFKALSEICTELARSIAADGEGASRLVTCTVMDARSEESAERLAKAVVGSSLVKAAMFGADANWGRVLCAMGYSGAEFDPETVDVSFGSVVGEVTVCRQGAGLDFDEDQAKSILSQDEVVIEVDLHEGEHQATCWGCDLTYDYVKINGEYRT